MTRIPDIRAIKDDGVKAAAVNTTSSAHRLSNIKASAASTDPKKKEAYAFAKRGCERLGMALDAVAQTGGTRELDKAMTEMKWTNTDRMALKSALHAIGCIA